MAEQVQASLDNMVAPLRDLLERGVFTEEEIRAIVARRRESEYLLRRRAVRKADFLRYIQAEMQLEQLRKIRSKRLPKEKKDNDDDNEALKPIGDVHIVRHIHLLFTRALRKFRSDVSLHLQHAAFAKQARSYNRLTRIYTQALQVHSRHVGLWIEAASHEFFGHKEEEDTDKIHGGGEIASARVLLQRGLRVNPKAQELWVQYFCMEMHNIQKMRGRREILLLQDNEEDSSKKEEDPLFADAPIPTVVYNNAIKAISDDVAFRLQFLELCRLFPQTEKLEGHVASTIERDFADKPEAWIVRATFRAEKEKKKRQEEEEDGYEEESPAGFAVRPEGVEEEEPVSKKLKYSFSDPVLNILSEATDTLSTPEMYLQIIQFIPTYLQDLQEQSQWDNVREVEQFQKELFDAVKRKPVVSPDLVLERASYLHSSPNEKTKEAFAYLQEYVDSQSGEPEIKVVETMIAFLAGPLNKEPAEVKAMLRTFLNKYPVESPNHLQILLELFGALLDDADPTEKQEKELAGLFEKILLLAAGRSVYYERQVFEMNSIPAACIAYLEYAFKNGGVDKARHVVDMILLRSSFCEPRDKSSADLHMMTSFFDQAIEYEKKSPKKDAKKAKQRRKRLYDSAIRLYGELLPQVADQYRRQRDRDILF